MLCCRRDEGITSCILWLLPALSAAEKNYSITELKTLAVVWAIQHYHAYLYGNEVTVITDHSAVKAILQTPSPNGKHARWWLKVFASGVGKVQLTYRPGRENVRADALSRNPVAVPAADHDDRPQLCAVGQVTSTDISELLKTPSQQTNDDSQGDFGCEQRQDPDLQRMIHFLETGSLPDDVSLSQKTAAQALQFSIVHVDGILYFVIW